MFRKITPAEGEMILNWINNRYNVEYESISELLHETDIEELSEIMYECAFGINHLLHYDNHNIYFED